MRFRFQMHSSRFQISAASGILEIRPQGVENEGKHWTDPIRQTTTPDKLETVSTDRQTATGQCQQQQLDRHQQQTPTNRQQADSKQTRQTERQTAGTLPFHQ